MPNDQIGARIDRRVRKCHRIPSVDATKKDFCHVGRALRAGPLPAHVHRDHYARITLGCSRNVALYRVQIAWIGTARSTKP